MKLAACVLPLLLCVSTAHARYPVLPISERKAQIKKRTTLDVRDVDLTDLYPAYNISIPVDHFPDDPRYEPHSNETFELRYWFDASHYREGGPIIVLHGGETDGEGRLPFLQKGILGILTRETNGIGVVMEHRYYGQSFPTKDLSTESLRFLTTEQALADSAYFAQNVVFPGLEHLDLTAPNTPYILYGGSYAGAQVAFLRVQHPDIFWGAISSSGVTKAIYDYWEYFEPVRKGAPQHCVKTTQTLVDIVDQIALHQKDEKLTTDLKNLFGMGELTHLDDFANVLASGIYGWQSTNWDPAISNPSFFEYCGNITAHKRLYPVDEKQEQNAKALIKAAGYGRQKHILIRLLNFVGYIKTTQVTPCLNRGGTLDDCFNTHDPDFYKLDDIDQTWRCWPYQFCTEWGYLQTGSGVPPHIKPLISRLIDVPYTSIVCREAFNIHTPADVNRVNKYGGFDIEYPRLAFVDGSADPWLEATPHASHARKRRSTPDKPFILIQDAVHHWDENGLLPNETTPELPPKRIKKVQAEEVQFVKKWLRDWKREHHKD
ncbi:hypothetical protein VTO42DRAFT_6000 [Malbranchea cinnamomea]